MLRLANGCISIAFLTGLMFVPAVIMAGLLTDHSAVDRVPADITVAALRGTLDPMGPEAP